MYRPSNAARILSLILALTLFACKKKDEAPIDTGMAMAPPPAPVALKVDGIETGKGLNADKTVANDAHDFGVRDTVYVSVKTVGTGTGKLTAKWTYEGATAANESSKDIAPTGDANHEFHITKASAWPKGDYKVEILLDGVSAGTKDFTIK